MKSIAFIDDEQGVLDGLRRSLRKFRGEWDIDFYLSGQEFLNALEEKSYDIIVSDMRMPGLNGAKTLLAAKELTPDSIRFVLSGYATDELIVESVHAAHQFLPKPTEGQELIGSIKRAIQMQSFLESSEIRAKMASLHSLPTLPEIYNELMKEISSKDFSLANVGEIVEKDLALSTSVLRLVNSAFFGLVRNIDTPSEAVSILGVDSIKNLALSSAVFSSFEGSRDAKRRIRELNSMGQQIGLLVGKFADKCLIPSTRFKDHAQVAAMMLGLGELIELQLNSQSKEDLANVVISHEEMASFLLGIWAMPFPILTAARWYKQPSLAGEEEQYPLALVHAAWAMYTMAKSSQEIDLESELIDTAYLISAVGSEVVTEWQTMAEKFLMEDPEHA